MNKPDPILDQVPLATMYAFAEWCGKNYVRLHGCWVQKFQDERQTANHASTEDLYAKYVAIIALIKAAHLSNQSLNSKKP